MLQKNINISSKFRPESEIFCGKINRKIEIEGREGGRNDVRKGKFVYGDDEMRTVE